jgi:transmembrane sensor
MMEQDYWELLENDAFVHWVLNPDEGADRYWETWIREDPRRISQVEQAREAIGRLRYPALSDKSALAGEIWQGIAPELLSAPTFTLPGARRLRYWWAAAAVIALVALGAGSWFYAHKAGPAPSSTIAVNRQPGNTIIQCSNQTLQSQKIYLVDGSVVTLEPHSSLSYPRLLAQKNRAVILKGNAFFEIAPDPGHPFLVRTGDIVTQVLGTSFRIDADPDKEDVNVVVRTGKVSVYKESDFDSGNPIFCTLLPRQEAVFHKKGGSLAFEPNAEVQLLEAPAADNVNLTFDDEPVGNILDRLENMYHIRILYNKDSLRECRLTTSLQEERLSDKLNIICKAINAGYHIQGDTIVIDGGHCQ